MRDGIDCVVKSEGHGDFAFANLDCTKMRSTNMGLERGESYDGIRMRMAN